MQLLARLAALSILLSSVIPGIIASPLEQSPNEAGELQRRASQMMANRQCTSPAQINLVGDPGMNTLGSCGWKMWVACTTLAAGVCLLPCAEGGLADPACDVCLAAMGGLGCKNCVTNDPHDELWGFLVQEMATVQPRVVNRLQTTYCDTPKKAIPPLQLPSGVNAAAPVQTSLSPNGMSDAPPSQNTDTS
ncbi:hypothetical protein ACLMJK_001931 [Lecanora helva]